MDGCGTCFGGPAEPGVRALTALTGALPATGGLKLPPVTPEAARSMPPPGLSTGTLLSIAPASPATTVSSLPSSPNAQPPPAARQSPSTGRGSESGGGSGGGVSGGSSYGSTSNNDGGGSSSDASPELLKPCVQEAVDEAREAISASASYLRVVADAAVAAAAVDARPRATTASVAAAEQLAADAARQVHGVRVDVVPVAQAQLDEAWSRAHKAGVNLIVDDAGVYVGMVCQSASSVQAAVDIRDAQHREARRVTERGGGFDGLYCADATRFTNVVVFAYDSVKGEAATNAVTSAVEDLLYSTFSSSTRWRVYNAVRPAMRACARYGRDDFSWQTLIQGLGQFLQKNGNLAVPISSHYAPHGKEMAFWQHVSRLRREQEELRAAHPVRHALLTAMGFDWRTSHEAYTERIRHSTQAGLVGKLLVFLRRHNRLQRRHKDDTTKESRLAQCMSRVLRNGSFAPLHLRELDQAAQSCPTLKEFPRRRW